jgi:mono/diheme cytochrome c family protein
MSKRTATSFAVVVLFLAVGLPLWATTKDADTDSSPAAVASSDEPAKIVFQQNCGPCHTLKKGGTDGVVGPNLDQSAAAASAESVLSFIEGGSQGRMPAGILQGDRAKEVAEFVAKYAGQ